MKRDSSQIGYDKEHSVLSIRLRRGKSVDSDIQGNAVVDYDKKGKIIRISLYNFSFEQFRRSSAGLRQFSRSFKMPVRAK